MPIVSSLIHEDHAQHDRRRSVTEHHTDHLGVLHRVSYLAEVGTDAQAVMAARVSSIENGLAQAEVQRDIDHILSGDFGAVTSQHATMTDIRAALRALYREGSGEETGRVAAFLLTLADARLRALFNITQGQVAALRGRLQTRADVVADLDGLVGE